jgi:hypothetical protein
MLKAIFMIATIGPAGPLHGEVNDTSRFKTEAECVTFGDHMTPRYADWVRGRLNADLGHPVAVKYRCEIDGDPA